MRISKRARRSGAIVGAATLFAGPTIAAEAAPGPSAPGGTAPCVPTDLVPASRILDAVDEHVRTRAGYGLPASRAIVESLLKAPDTVLSSGYVITKAELAIVARQHRIQDQLNRAIPEIEKRVGLDRFTEVRIDHSRGAEITITAKNTPIARAAIADLLPAEAVVVFDTAPVSKNELRASAQKAADLVAAGNGRVAGAKVSTISVDPITHRITADVVALNSCVKPIVTDAFGPDIKIDLKGVSGPVIPAVGSVTMDHASGQDHNRLKNEPGNGTMGGKYVHRDPSPGGMTAPGHWPHDGHCTLAFPVTMRDGSRRYTTAGHCNPGVAYERGSHWGTGPAGICCGGPYGWGQGIGQMNRWAIRGADAHWGQKGTDSALLSIDDSNMWTNMIYTGPAGGKATTLTVEGWWTGGPLSAGSQVQISEGHSSITRPFTIDIPWTSWTNLGNTLWGSSGPVCAQGGDSGAPVFTQGDHRDAWAYSIFSGTSDGGQFDTCLSGERVYMTSVQHAMENWGDVASIP